MVIIGFVEQLKIVLKEPVEAQNAQKFQSIVLAYQIRLFSLIKLDTKCFNMCTSGN